MSDARQGTRLARCIPTRSPSFANSRTDRHPSARRTYAGHHVDAALRAEVESLLPFDGQTAGSLHNYIASVAAGMVADHSGLPAQRPTRTAAGTVPMTAPLTGRRFGAFEVDGLIGAGGMGEVYRARDMRLGRDVAIKILPHAFRDDRERVARFEREARVLASLNHPHIGVVYGLEEVDGSQALVMELVEGEDLAERSGAGRCRWTRRSTSPGRWPKRSKRAQPRASSIAISSQRTSSAGRTATVKVLDFGLAKALMGTDAVSGTQGGVIGGTPAYMSPEQARGEAVDGQADIWSFGVTLFELLTAPRRSRGRRRRRRSPACSRQARTTRCWPRTRPRACVA